MLKKIPLSSLSSKTFLQEVHHFLWAEPYVSTGSYLDHGWNCRDHTWITALLCHCIGHNTAISGGKSALIRGPTNTQRGLCIYQDQHWWVSVEDLGSFDLSINPNIRYEAQEYCIPVTCLFANKLHPQGRGQVFFFKDVGEYKEAMSSLIGQRNHTTLLYTLENMKWLDQGHVTYAPEWIRSPLTDTLRSRFGSPADVYCALFLHLHSFLSGTAKSLSSLTKEAAWAQVSKSREGAIDRTLVVLQSERVLRPETQKIVAADAPQAAHS